MDASADLIQDRLAENVVAEQRTDSSEHWPHVTSAVPAEIDDPAADPLGLEDPHCGVQ
jgi:hypothetical protein